MFPGTPTIVETTCVASGKVDRMRILAVNCGSSTLKFKLVEMEEGVHEQEREVARGTVERIGGDSSDVQFSAKNDVALQQRVDVPDHGKAIHWVLDWLRSTNLVSSDGPGAVGHRIVHGADYFDGPVLIDDEVMSVIQELGDLAPLHNRMSLATIKAVRETLGPSVPMVAVFDTAFHRTMPEHAAQYAIAKKLTDRYGIRRYGFHGTAHRYMTARYAAITGTPVEQARLVTMQLGNGCSATAVKEGRSVDTSMGFTPLEGLVMGTRSGNIDPSVVAFLARREEVKVSEVENWLNKESGLLGVSGISQDMRELLEAEAQGDDRAALALEMFCYRVRAYIGAYLAIIGGADAVVFGGGIGENAPEIRARICADMDWCGLTLDQELNNDTVGSEGHISTKDSKTQAYVVTVDEEMMIAQDTANCLRRHEQSGGK